MTREQYEEKKKELNKQFKREKLKSFLIWLAYNVVSIAIICIVTAKFFPTRYPFAIAVGFASVYVSTWIWAKSSVELGRCERQQMLLLQEEQSMGRFKYGE